MRNINMRGEKTMVDGMNIYEFALFLAVGAMALFILKMKK